MELHGTLSFALSGEGAKASILIGEQCWERNYPSLMEAVAQAFVDNLLNSEEAVEAAAVERHMIPWVKPVRLTAMKLHEMGFTLQKASRQAA